MTTESETLDSALCRVLAMPESTSDECEFKAFKLRKIRAELTVLINALEIAAEPKLPR